MVRPCRVMSPVVDAVAAEYAGRLRVVKVDVDLSHRDMEEGSGHGDG